MSKAMTNYTLTENATKQRCLEVSLGVYSLGVYCLGPPIVDLGVYSLGVYSLGVYSLGVYSLALPMLDLDIHMPVLKKNYRGPLNVNVV